MKTIEVSGSHGALYVDSTTGKVVGYVPQDWDETEQGEGYGDIVRVDLDEHKEYWGLKQPKDSIDILDVGYWYLKDGVEHYEEPVEDWREEFSIHAIKQHNNGENNHN